MCSVNVDGSAAAVLVSEKKAKELGMQRAIKVRASALASDPYTDRDLVMPKDGIGTGRALLKQNAPKTWSYLQQAIRKLEKNYE